MTRRLSLLVLLAVLSLSVLALARPAPVSPQLSPSSAPVRAIQPGHGQRSTLDEIIYEEHWESGTLDGWTATDLNTQSLWHLDTHDAFGGTGTSWWMGDPAVGDSGGYFDDQYMTLDSPPITLPATSPTLKFFHRWKSEEASAHAPWNAWDGMNLRISTNGGTTWTVVPSSALTPAYTHTALYSFGWMHCEGTSIPGWTSTTGSTDGQAWHQQIANLTAWAGQTVKLRWAFASDPAFSGAWADPNGDPSMFGWMIDNIRVYSGTDTVFTDDCNSTTGWTPGVGYTSGGDQWHVEVDGTAPEGPHILRCNNPTTHLYNHNMRDAIISPYISLAGLSFGTINVDLNLRGETGLNLTNVDSAFDNWHVEITVDSGRTWCAMTATDCSVPPLNYGGPFADWSLYSAINFQTPAPFQDLYPYVGRSVRFRITQRTHCGTAAYEGLSIDDFTVTHLAGYPDDVSCYSLQVRYPNVATRPFKIRSYFINAGQNDQNTVQGYWRVGTQTWRPFMGTFPLVSNATRTRDTLVTIASTGTYQMQSRASIGSDQNHANDTSTVRGIEVAPAGSPLEMGYDNHALDDTFFYWPNNPAGSGQMVHFTAVADSVITGGHTFSITNVKAQFYDGQTADATVRVHIYLGGTTAPGPEIYSEVHTVTVDETGSAVWKTFDVSGDPDTHNISQDFWVWLETLDSGPTPHYPALLGVRARPWTDVHYYDWAGTGNPNPYQALFHIHATLDASSDVHEIGNGVTPTEWSLTQNYPNPFNPTTEIRYTVPRAERMTLKVYNLMGQEVATLVDAMVNPGTYAASFDGANLSSGVYVYRLESASFSASHKMVLMK